MVPNRPGSQASGLSRPFGDRSVFGKMQQAARARYNNERHQNSTNTKGSGSALSNKQRMAR
jgi:hypothetical protein